MIQMEPMITNLIVGGFAFMLSLRAVSISTISLVISFHMVIVWRYII